MTHPALRPDSVAVVAGGAAGIGLAAAEAFARHGMAVSIADQAPDKLNLAERRLRDAGARDVLVSETDVSDIEAVAVYESLVAERFGGADILMNNAGIQPGSGMFDDAEAWRRILDVNFWGIVNGVRAFAPRMMERARPGMIVCTGSKQGITTPPGDPAYNISKAAVKAYAEALAHELRNHATARLTAHLLIPGFVFTELTSRGRSERPDAAWTPEQTAAFMMESLERGDFYILCPDNDVDRALDEKRMAWAVGDIIENRPPLSRWHPDHAGDFEAFARNR